MTFYDNVKRLVKENTTMTLESFIGSLGINYGTYHTQRKSGNLPRADESVKIAQALGVSVEYLVTGENSNNSEIIESIRNHLKNMENDVNRLK
jgi:hypothetical protein